MARIPYASWRAKAEGMSYRHQNNVKPPGLVSCQQVMTKRDLQWLVRDVVRSVPYRPKAYRMCTLLKIAKKWCAQCKNDKTCLSRAENALFYNTRALCWKVLWCARSENEKTFWSRAQTFFFVQSLLCWKHSKVVCPVLISGWERYFIHTRALCRQSLKSCACSAKMTKRGDLGLKMLFCTNSCSLLKIANEPANKWVAN